MMVWANPLPGGRGSVLGGTRILGLLYLLAATTCLAQQRLDLYLPTTTLVAGQSIQLRAIMRNAQGSASDVTASAAWTSSATAVVRVDAQGMATAARLGRSDLSARVGNLQSRAAVTVLPARIEVEPAYAELRVGEQLQMRATAFDSNGEPIPHDFNQWEITGANGNQINAAGINGSGLIAALASGRITVRAVVNYGGDPAVARVWGSATVVIQPVRAYRLRRVLSSDMVRHSFQVRPLSIGQMRANDAGQVVVPACLDGLVCGLLLLDHGRVDLLAPGGLTTAGGNFGNSWALTDTPSQAAINKNGEVLIRQQAHPGSEALLVVNRQRSAPILMNRSSLGEFANVGGFSVGKDSFNDHGEAVFLAFTGNGQSLFRYLNRSFDLVTTPDAVLAGTATPFFLADYGIDNNSTIYFMVQGPGAVGRSRVTLYRKEGFGAPARVTGPGDALAGGIVASVWHMAVDRTGGGVAFVAILEDGRQLLVRDARGTRTTIALQSPVVYSAGPSGVLVFANGSRGNGLYAWRGDALVSLLPLGTLLDNGEPVQQIEAAYLTASGELYAQVRTPSNPLVVIGPGNRTLVAGGSRVDVTAGLQLRALGVRGSPIMALPAPGRVLIQLGSPSSVFELDGEGGLSAKLLAGDIVGENAIVGGQAIATRGGDIYFVPSDGAVYRLRGNTIEPIVATGTKLADGATANGFQVLGANESGAVVLIANTNQQQRLVVAEGGSLRTLAQSMTPSPTGGTLTNWNEVAIDESGRVMAQVQTNRIGQQGDLVLYAGGSAEPLLRSGQTRIAGMLAGSGSGLRARGNRLYAGIQEFPCCDSQLVEFSDGRWSAVAAPGDRMPDGPTMRSVSMFDVNGNGEAMFTAQAQGGFSTLIHLGGEGMRFVQSDYLPTDEGDVIVQMSNLVFNDDGTGWLSAFDARGRFVIYAIEPVRR